MIVIPYHHVHPHSQITTRDEKTFLQDFLENRERIFFGGMAWD